VKRLDTESRRVDPSLTAWRFRLLVRARVPDWLAADLAADNEADVPRLLDLIARGCPPVTAVRILAPTDWPEDFYRAE
jgi:hypothetical protein